MPNPVTDIEERQAWDQYVSAQLSSIVDGALPEDVLTLIVRDADRMLALRRKRFGDAK